MKKINITNEEAWKSKALNEPKQYKIPENCRGGICIDAGVNIGDFPLFYDTRFDKFICYDVLDYNIEQAKQNTKELNSYIEIHKRAVYSKSGDIIDVMGYDPNNGNLDHFGNSGNVGCVKYEGESGNGWKPENTIDKVETISIDEIIEKYEKIKLLKIDVEGSEYEFLLNKDLSKIEFIAGEFHFDDDKIQSLVDWISKTHKHTKISKHIHLFELK